MSLDTSTDCNRQAVTSTHAIDKRSQVPTAIDKRDSEWNVPMYFGGAPIKVSVCLHILSFSQQRWPVEPHFLSTISQSAPYSQHASHFLTMAPCTYSTCIIFPCHSSYFSVCVIFIQWLPYFLCISSFRWSRSGCLTFVQHVWHPACVTSSVWYPHVWPVTPSMCDIHMYDQVLNMCGIHMSNYVWLSFSFSANCVLHMFMLLWIVDSITWVSGTSWPNNV